MIRGKKKGVLSSLILGFLRLLSLPYRVVVVLRNWCYDKEWFWQYNPPVPVVISVGNIVVGGTGKTPVTMMVANEFYADRVIGILSRGYHSPAEKLGAPITLCAGKGPLHSAAYCGDEPYLLAANLPKAYIFVGKDRFRSAVLAAKAGVDICILDDGMQHRRISRDYEIVVVDADDPLGQGRYFPGGLLRESPKGLERADLVVINHVADASVFAVVAEQVRRYTAAPFVGTQWEILQLLDQAGSEVRTLEGRRVALFCGIAQPDRFLDTVKQSGAVIVGQEFCSDHYPFVTGEIVKMAEKYRDKGAEMLVCTEKDKVKLVDIADWPLPIVWLKMRLKIVAGQEAWTEFIQKVKKDVSRRT